MIGALTESSGTHRWHTMTLSASSFASPSYLFKNRFGVFYFRSRIPKTIQTKYQIKQTEIKKSLRTKDHRQALNYARRMWVQMEDSDYEQKLRELDNNIYDYEENLELQKRLLNKFKRVRDDGHSDEKKRLRMIQNKKRLIG